MVTAKSLSCKYRIVRNSSFSITALLLIRAFLCYSDVFSMSKWALNGVDFRCLISFKNHLFDSPELDQRNCITLSEYRRIRNQHDDAKIRDAVSGTEA